MEQPERGGSANVAFRRSSYEGPRIVGLAGDRPGVGKSTAATYLVESHGFRIVSIGDLVKAELDVMVQVHGFRYDEAEKEDFRPGLSWWTTFRLTRCSPDYWLEAATAGIGEGRIVIPDIRYPNEADYVVRSGGLLIKIERTSADRRTESTETALDSYDFPYVVSNTADDRGAVMFAAIDRLLVENGLSSQTTTRADADPTNTTRVLSIPPKPGRRC